MPPTARQATRGGLAQRRERVTDEPGLPRQGRPAPGRRAGLRQFLDIGTGIPSASDTHEVAQAIVPETRIVYIDNDPIVLAHARALRASAPDGAVAYLDAGLHRPGDILRAAARTLDFGQPVAVMMLMVLHMISDADEPGLIIGRLLDTVPAGSYPAVSHPPSDILPQGVAEAQRRLNQRLGAEASMTAAAQAEIAQFFDGLQIAGPGLAQVHQWRPVSASSAIDGPTPAAMPPRRPPSRLRH